MNSVLAQTFTDFECILVDDCSPCNSGKICDEYAKRDKRIKVIHKQKNEGLPQARKTGFENSSGEYIQFLDSDDYIEKDMIEKMYKKAVSGNFDIVVCDYFTNKNEREKIHKQDFSSFDKITIMKKVLLVKIKSVVWNKLVKKEVVQLAEFPVYSYSEDYVITMQNIHNSSSIGYIDSPLYHYCYNEASLSEMKKQPHIKNNKRWHFEKNENWRILVKFLKDKYGDLKIFEPELSNAINKLKKTYMKDKELRANKDLFLLYPESKYYQWSIKTLIKKPIKFLLGR